jgi:hypothetical protein
MRLLLSALVVSWLATGCVTTPKESSGGAYKSALFSASKEEVNNGDFSKVAICRPSSIKRAGTIPDIRINGVPVFELSSGSKFELTIKADRQVDLHLEKNFFAQRFKERTLTSFRAKRGEEKYILVFGLAPSLIDSISSVVGAGADGYIDLPQGAGWRISVVSKEEYESKCNQN